MSRVVSGSRSDGAGLEGPGQTFRGRPGEGRACREADGSNTGHRGRTLRRGVPFSEDWPDWSPGPRGGQGRVTAAEC